MCYHVTKVVSQSVVDPCFFTIQRGGKWLKMALHVDDAAVFSNSRELYDDVFKGMLRIFKIRDDPLEHFWGLLYHVRLTGRSYSAKSRTSRNC